MKYVLILVALTAALYGAHRYLALAAESEVASLRAVIAAAPAPVVRGDLPQIVLDFVQVNGAEPGALAHSVRFTQEAEIEMEPGRGFNPLVAEQHVTTGGPGFLWQAEQRSGAVTLFRIVDAFLGGEGRLTVRFLGSLPIVNAKGADIDRSEAMRYLAELPWAPDAILGNPDLVWRYVSPREVAVAMALPDGPASVTFLFDEAGDISEVRAANRPARGADGQIVLRDWRGVFRDYGKIGGRRIPRFAEVGYVLEDGYKPYFRGRITSYELLGAP